MTEEAQPVAGIRFRNAGKIYYFDSAGLRLEAGDYVVVQTARGPEIGKVVIGNEQVVVNELGDEPLQPVLRMANEGDLRRMDSLRERAKEILPEARALADSTGLPARIDSADFTLDGSRLTFTFTSEERLDYREFNRRAADQFNVRVDMRQVGARDRSKLAGGYGICGRELCCSNWLTTFPSISIRMAKDQDLPLNPQKISGLCGRLLCCLSYEEAGYREMRATLPKVGQRCSTPTGEGRVIGVNILRRQVTLVVSNARVEVGDRDLGTVVRWDTASKTGDPPPSLTREQAVEQGLLDPAALLEVEDADDWTVPDSAGRGRLPGGGPRKIMRSKPDPALAEPPVSRKQAQQRPTRAEPPRQPRGRQGRPGSPTQRGGPVTPPPGGRVYQRGGQTPAPDGATPPAGAENPASSPDGDDPTRRRRGRRGGRGRGRGSGPGPAQG